MFYPHTRQLGSQAGVQLNQLVDNTEGFVTGLNDQVVATVGRFKRGKIDGPFLVNRANLRRKLGPPESLRVSALNEAYVQSYEAVNNGAQQAVIVRLTPATAVNQFCVLSIDVGTGVGTFAASLAAPSANYVLYFKDAECFNDGILAEITALKALDPSTGAQVATKIVTLRIRDPDGSLRYEVTGSLDQTAVDEYGQDYYIGSKFAAVTRNIVVVAAQNVTIAVTAACYGKAADGSEKLSKTATPLVLFSEGGTGYTSDDYDRVLASLESSVFDYGYAVTAGSQATALIAKLAALNIRANRQLLIDVPGDLTPTGVATFVAQLGLASRYIQFYWAPLRSDDPVNGGKAVIGISGMQAGQRAGRNANTNTYGLSPKNFPVAGKDWPVNRTGVEQLTTPSDPQLSDLADAKVNPVIYQVFNDGGRYVYLDSLTSAQTTGYSKLISVAEMSSSLDDMISKYGKEVMQLPMATAISRMTKFLTSLLDGAGASGWLVASDNPDLGAKGYVFTLTRNAQRPVDRLDLTYGTHYDGVTRAIFVTQVLQK